MKENFERQLIDRPKRWTLLFLLFWLLLAFIYESPNLVYFLYRLGTLNPLVASHLKIYLDLNEPWYPSIGSLLRDPKKAKEKNEGIFFKKASFLNPWNASEYIIISNAPINLERNSESYRKLVSKEVTLPWAEVWLLRKFDSQKAEAMYVPNYGLYIVASSEQALRGIASIQPIGKP